MIPRTLLFCLLFCEGIEVDMNEEIWKDVVGYEGLYKVSNKGNVFSNYVNRKLKPGTHKDGYKFVILRKDSEEKYWLVHRLVGLAFVDNPMNLPWINHKDETPSNNNDWNLEWCNEEYNATYNDAHIKRGLAMGYKVYAYNNECKLVYEYPSTQEASRDLNLSNGCLCNCCNGDLITYKNLIWSYDKLSNEEIINRFKQKEQLKHDRKNNSLSKRVVQRDLNGNFIAEYSSAREAGRQLGFSSSLVAGVCRGDHKQTHGFIFEYDEAS